ncbi:MAG: hypothetical protein CEE43_16975 [Promethearchaeota archaeon Loki_b32]|nr:MAG: hypothetical protein CEE43_16975 [Candidatus Lokiarchaeota archaeon Loki_b32]
MALELNSSRIKFGDLLTLVDEAINSGKSIQIKRNMISQDNNNMKFIRWLEKHRIISLTPIGVEAPKKILIKSRSRKVEISLQLKALNLPIKEIAREFNVKVATAQGYLKEFDSITEDYIKILKFILDLKGITLDTNITEFPSFPIRVSIGILKGKLPQNEFEQVVSISEQNRYIKKITGQKLGTTDLSILLPKKSK